MSASRCGAVNDRSSWSLSATPIARLKAVGQGAPCAFSRVAASAHSTVSATPGGLASGSCLKRPTAATTASAVLRATALARIITISAAGALALAGHAVAQPYAITWYSIDAGGRTSPAAGGSYGLVGTIGQHDAGPSPHTGGVYVCLGGFWSLGGGGGAPPCYANCDASTAAPILNVNDFICFQTRFTLGCQ